MSAYGAIAPPQSSGELRPLLWPLSGGLTLTTHPITLSQAPPDLVDYLYADFAQELEEGKTYPQEGPITREAFEAYFFTSASTTVVGVLHASALEDVPATLEGARGGRDWSEALGGSYYIKPNYPGRSSHNAGFIVPHCQRGKKISWALGKSYLEYAPKLGYRASVFNLVYKNNLASVRVWDSLGFERVGLIPNAGRLKSGPNGEEEYVDAMVLYKSFV